MPPLSPVGGLPIDVGFDTWRLRGTLNGSGSQQFGRSLSGDSGWVDGGLQIGKFHIFCWGRFSLKMIH